MSGTSLPFVLSPHCSFCLQIDGQPKVMHQSEATLHQMHISCLVSSVASNLISNLQPVCPCCNDAINKIGDKMLPRILPGISFPPSTENQSVCCLHAFVSALQNDQMELAAELFKKGPILPEGVRAAFISAAAELEPDKLWLFMKNIFEYYRCQFHAGEMPLQDVVPFLLQHSILDQETVLRAGLSLAKRSVSLLNYFGFFISDRSSHDLLRELVVLAARENETEVLRQLAGLNYICPCALDDALMEAVKQGHVKLLELFQQIPLSQDIRKKAIEKTFQMDLENVGSIRSLLFPTQSPQECVELFQSFHDRPELQKQIFVSAARANASELVKILTDSNVVPDEIFSDAYLAAASKGCLGTVKILAVKSYPVQTLKDVFSLVCYGGHDSLFPFIWFDMERRFVMIDYLLNNDSPNRFNVLMRLMPEQRDDLFERFVLLLARENAVDVLQKLDRRHPLSPSLKSAAFVEAAEKGCKEMVVFLGLKGINYESLFQAIRKASLAGHDSLVSEMIPKLEQCCHLMFEFFASDDFPVRDSVIQQQCLPVLNRNHSLIGSLVLLAVERNNPRVLQELERFGLDLSSYWPGAYLAAASRGVWEMMQFIAQKTDNLNRSDALYSICLHGRSSLISHFMPLEESQLKELIELALDENEQIPNRIQTALELLKGVNDRALIEKWVVHVIDYFSEEEAIQFFRVHGANCSPSQLGSCLLAAVKKKFVNLKNEIISKELSFRDCERAYRYSAARLFHETNRTSEITDFDVGFIAEMTQKDREEKK